MRVLLPSHTPTPTRVPLPPAPHTHPRYAHGLGLSRDFHLAKRHYDQAMQASAEAWAPVRLALVELQFLMWWDSHTEGKGGDPYRRLASWISNEGDLLSMAPKWDTILIILLSLTLGVVLLLRQRQILRP